MSLIPIGAKCRTPFPECCDEAQEMRRQRDALERELNEAKLKAENLHKLVGWSDGKTDVEELLNERDELRAKLAAQTELLGVVRRLCDEALAEFDKLKGQP